MMMVDTASTTLGKLDTRYLMGKERYLIQQGKMHLHAKDLRTDCRVRTKILSIHKKPTSSFMASDTISLY